VRINTSLFNFCVNILFYRFQFLINTHSKLIKKLFNSSINFSVTQKSDKTYFLYNCERPHQVNVFLWTIMNDGEQEWMILNGCEWLWTTKKIILKDYEQWTFIASVIMANKVLYTNFYQFQNFRRFFHLWLILLTLTEAFCSNYRYILIDIAQISTLISRIRNPFL